MSTAKFTFATLGRLDRMLLKGLTATSIFCYVGVLLLIFTSVMIRFLNLDSTILSFNVWSYDVTNFGVIWMVYMGAVIGVRNSDHISITMIKDGLNKKNPIAGKTLLLLNDMLSLGVILIFTKAIYSTLMAARTQLLPCLPIVKFWWVLPIFLAFMLMTIYMFSNLVRNMLVDTPRNETFKE